MKKLILKTFYTLMKINQPLQYPQMKKLLSASGTRPPRVMMKRTVMMKSPSTSHPSLKGSTFVYSKLQVYFKHCEPMHDSREDTFDYISKLRQHINITSPKMMQTTLTDYFTPLL
jgi:hypothetical protein